MDKIELKINRVGSWLSRKNAYAIWFCETKICTLYHEKDPVVLLENQRGILRLRENGTKFALHPIEKEVVLFPERMTGSRIECDVKATINWVGALTLGLITPLRKISITIKY